MVVKTLNTGMKNCGKIRLVGGQSIVSTRVVFSKDSRFLFCGCGRRIRIYSSTTAELVRELCGHSGDVTDLRLNPSNHLQLVSSSLAGEVFFWDFSDGAILKKFQFKDPLYCLNLHSAHQNSVFVTKQVRSKQDENHFEYALARFSTTQEEDQEQQRMQTLLTKTSRLSKQTCFTTKGDYLGALKKNKFYLWNFETIDQLCKHKSSGSMFTCLTFHPSKLCAATGHADGQIKIWHVLDKKTPVITVLHWHADIVQDLSFTCDGSYLLSGGEECVLVLWQFETHHKQFLPRLGACIKLVESSHDGTLVAVSHLDNVITLVSGVNLEVTKTIQGLKKGSILKSGLTIDPRSHSVVLNSMPGKLQFFSPDTQKQALTLDVIQQNFVSRPDTKLVCTEIEHVAFNQSGSWMATIEHRDDKHTVPELRLKFWELNTFSQCFELNTCADPPHDQVVTSLQFQPEGEGSQTPLAVTSSLNGEFKVWVLTEEREIKGKYHAWMCQSVGYYCYMPCSDAKFSQDGSILAVAHKEVISLWDAEVNELRTTLQMPQSQEIIKQLSFGQNESAQFLLVGSDTFLTVWNLLTLSVWWRLEANVCALAADPFSHHVAVFASSDNQTHLYVFDPSSAEPVALQSDVSSGMKVLSAAFEVQQTTDISSGNDKVFQFRSKLYFQTVNQNIFIVTEEEEEEREFRKLRTQDVPVGMEEFRKVFGASETRKADSTMIHASRRSIHGTPSASVVRQMLSTPSHVLPPITDLCENFLDSLVVSKTNPRTIGEDSDEDSDNDESNNIGEDSDSDMEIPESTENRNTPVKIHQAGSLRTVQGTLVVGDFSWLEDRL